MVSMQIGYCFLLLLAALCAPVECQFGSLIEGAKERIFGKPTEILLDVPSCLIELKGGIQGVEDTLLEGVNAGKTWAVLVTSAHDSISYPATKSFYEAVQEACSASEADADSTTQSFEFGDQKADYKDWKFAHLSFEGESDLIWRWWIWKVPTLLFVSSASQTQMQYDLRSWKIAFDLPSRERILEVVQEGYWENLPLWQSSLAPGGSLAIMPALLGRFFGLFYSVLDPVPKWLLTIIASTGGSLLISFLHSGGNTGGRRT